MNTTNKNRFSIVLLFVTAAFVSIKATAQKTDTLHIMISKKNIFYYYENSMHADGSNFMSTNAKGIRNVLMLFQYEAQGQNHQTIILLKVMDKSVLNESSQVAITEIKKGNYKQVKLNPVEKR